MKFQSIFILFNILLLVFAVLIVFGPVLFSGLDMALAGQESVFLSIVLRSSYFLMIVLAAIMVGFDVFYVYNRKLYALLEKEDWSALVTYLEDRVINKGKYSPRLVRLLANTYLVLSEATAVMSLENKAALAKPSLIDENALVFGTARVLGKDLSGAVRFFEARLYSVKPGLRLWVHWYYGFSLLLNRQFEKAFDEFSRLAAVSRNSIIGGLSAYFLSDIIRKSLPEKSSAVAGAAETGRERVLKALPTQKDWMREAVKIRSEIHAAVLSQYIEEAGQWLYKEKA